MHARHPEYTISSDFNSIFESFRIVMIRANNILQTLSKSCQVFPRGLELSCLVTSAIDRSESGRIGKKFFPQEIRIPEIPIFLEERG